MSRDPEFYYTQAERLVSEGKFAAAELMMRQAVELGGSNNQVYVAALGALLGLQEGRSEESLQLLQEQLTLHPDEPTLLVAQGLTARAAGQNDLAEESLRKAVKLNSEHAFAHHSLSKVLIDKGHTGEAETHACKAFALVPDQPDYALTAIELLEASGKQDYAFEVASLGASFCPQEMELVQKAVQGALAREEPERAWDALEESNEELPWVLGWKATLLDHQGQVEKADALLDVGRERFAEEPDFLFLEAAVLVRRQETQAALEVIERLLELAPTHRGALRLRADLSFSSQSTDEAIQDLTSMWLIEPKDEEIAQELVSSLYRARRYREALDVCQEWEKREEPVPPRLAVYLALSYASLGEPQEALQRLALIAPEWVIPALTEMAAYGCANAAEHSLREKLELMVPDEPTVVAPAPEQPPPKIVSSDDPIPGAEPGEAAAETAAPATSGGARLELPRPGLQTLLGESPAYDDDDDDDEEVWVEVDEETGEEWVWVDDDEDDEDEDDDDEDDGLY